MLMILNYKTSKLSTSESVGGGWGVLGGGGMEDGHKIKNISPSMSSPLRVAPTLQ